MGKLGERIGMGVGCISSGILAVLYLVWGAVRLFAIAGLVNRWLGTSFWPGAICAGIIAEVPIVSHALAVWGGVTHYGLALPYSALIFAPDAVLAIVVLVWSITASAICSFGARRWRVLLLVAASVAVGLWLMSRKPKDADGQGAVLDYHQFGQMYHAKAVSSDELLIEMPYCVFDLPTWRLLGVQTATLALRNAGEIIDFANDLQLLKYRHSLAVANNDPDIDYVLPHDWHIIVDGREMVVEPQARIVRYVDGNLEPAGRTWGFTAVDTNNTNTAIIGLTFYDRKNTDWTADYNQFFTFVASRSAMEH